MIEATDVTLCTLLEASAGTATAAPECIQELLPYDMQAPTAASK